MPLLILPVDKRSIASFIKLDERFNAINAIPIALSLFIVNDIPNPLSRYYKRQKLPNLYVYILFNSEYELSLLSKNRKKIYETLSI